MLDFHGTWKDHLPLVEFVYNNNYQASIQMAPFEALYGRPCRLPFSWAEVDEVETLGPKLVRKTIEKVKLIQQRIE